MLSLINTKKIVLSSLFVIAVFAALYYLWLSENSNKNHSFEQPDILVEQSHSLADGIKKGHEEENKSSSEKSDIEPESNTSELTFPITLDVFLPSGDKLSVAYKLDPSFNLPRPVKNTFDSYIFNLMELADTGVIGAASNVEALLKRCSSIPRNLRDQQNQLHYFLENGALEDTNAEMRGFNVDIGSQEYHQFYEDLQLQHKLCSKITENHLEKRESYREIAIKEGDFRILSEEALRSLDSDPLRFHSLSERSWQKGNLGALSSIAFSYINGIAPGTNGKPDYVTGYAYELASFIIQERLLSVTDRNSFQIDQLRIGLEEAQFRLTLQEQNIASEIAEKILSENEKCCVGAW